MSSSDLKYCTQKEKSYQEQEVLDFLSPVFEAVVSSEADLDKVMKLHVLSSMNLCPDQALGCRTVYQLTMARRVEAIAPQKPKTITYNEVVKGVQKKFKPVYDLLINTNLNVSKEEFRQEMNALLEELEHKGLLRDFKRYSKKAGRLLEKGADKVFEEKLKALRKDLAAHASYLPIVKEKIREKLTGFDEELKRSVLIGTSFDLYYSGNKDLDYLIEKNLKEELEAGKNNKFKALILLGLMGGAAVLRTYDSVNGLKESLVRPQDDSGGGGVVEEENSGEGGGGFTDENNNGVSDYAENYTDYDGDGIPYSLEMLIIKNYEVPDINGDGKINIADVKPTVDYDNNGKTLLEEFVNDEGMPRDSDMGGLPDAYEKLIGTNPYDSKDDSKDNDGDGLANDIEWSMPYDPTEKATYDGISDGKQDPDNDGLSNKDEIELTHTDPFNKDSDDNGITDGEEDFDDDGYTNKEEVENGTDPYHHDSDFEDPEWLRIAVPLGAGAIGVGIGYLIWGRDKEKKKDEEPTLSKPDNTPYNDNSIENTLDLKKSWERDQLFDK